MSDIPATTGPAGRKCFFRAAYFNIWKGGEQAYPLTKSADVVRLSKANIVAVQEAEGSTLRLAEMAGMEGNEKANFLCEYEIIGVEKHPCVDFAAIRVRLPNDRKVWAIRGYLHETLYGPYELRKGTSGFDPLANEEKSARLADLGQALAWIDEVVGEEDAVLLAGLNSPSHRDWTERAAPRNYGCVVEWPVTRLVESAGFTDAYRETHPDEVRHPGCTWTPGYPAPKVKRNEKHDRVDYVFYRGRSLRLSECKIVGESGRAADIVVRPWPSDHRVVVAEFEMP